MGYAKNGTGGGIHIRNGEKYVAFGNADISPATFVETVNNGGGELLLSSLTGEYYTQVSMVDADRIAAMYISGDYGIIAIGQITDDGIVFGTGVSVYMPEDRCGFFVMSGGTKIATFFINDSGYSIFHLHSISGTTLTLAVNLGDAIDFTGPAYYGAFKISDTQLISWSTGYNGGYKTNLYVLTISGDTYTKSSVFSLWNTVDNTDHAYTRYLHGCIISEGKVVLLAQEAFDDAPTNRAMVHLLNISGDTLSLVSSTEIDTENVWIHVSEMMPLTDGSAVIMTQIGSSSSIPLSLTLLTLSGNTVTVNSLNTGVARKGSDNSTPSRTCAGYELAVNYPDVWMLCGYGDFTVRLYVVDGNSLTYVSEVTAKLDGKIATYIRGNTQFGSDGYPVVPIGYDGSTSTSLATTTLIPGKIYNIGRLEVKEAESVIEGVSATSLSPEKSGKIWMLK